MRFRTMTILGMEIKMNVMMKNLLMLLPSPSRTVKESPKAKERAKAKVREKAKERGKGRKGDLASGSLNEPLANSMLLGLVPRAVSVRISILFSNDRCLEPLHKVMPVTLLLHRQNPKRPLRRPETERKRKRSDKWLLVKF